VAKMETINRGKQFGPESSCKSAIERSTEMMVE
jgi:hypothetical protein